MGPYADSTIAISAYNALVERGTPMTRQDIYGYLKTTIHPDLTTEQLDRAIKALKLKKLIGTCAHGEFSKDKRKRLIVSRTRGDMVEIENGRIIGGWSNWKWLEPTTKKMGFVFRPRDKALKVKVR